MDQRTPTVVVTGGAGFIGSHLVDRLLADTDGEIVVFDDLSRGRPAARGYRPTEPRPRLVVGDVRDADAVASVLRGADVVYHLAARDAADDLDGVFTTNVVGTFNVLRAAREHGIARVVFASSCEAYGEPVRLPVDEGHPLSTTTWHGASKVAGEAFCHAFRRAYGLQTVVLRLADTYGPGDFGRAIPTWLERAMAGQDLDLYGDKQVVDVLWVGYAVEALIRAAALDGPLPPINVGSGTGTRTLDLVRRVARLTGREGQIRRLPARAGQVTRFIANVERMQQLLKIDPPLDPLVHLSSLLPGRIGMAG